MKPIPLISGASLLPGGVQVLGNESPLIGDKARMLTEHADAINRAGFTLPPRVVLAQDCLDELRQRVLERTRMTWWRGDLSDYPIGIVDDVTRISKILSDTYGGNIPLAVRSSAFGDARGTGIYRSKHIRNVKNEILYAVAEVLGSHDDPDARLWRKRSQVPDGIAVIIEPLVHQLFETGSIVRAAPLLSGMGYSSSGIGPGFIKRSFGLGGGESNKLTREYLGQFSFSISEYLGRGSGNFLLNTLVMNDLQDFVVENVDDDFPDTGPLVSVEEAEFLSRVNGMSFESIFEGMRILEQELGVPVYIEWAMDQCDGKQSNYLLQLAKIDPQQHKWEFGDQSSVLMRMQDVRRGQPMEISAIVFIESRQQLEYLAKFNAKNSGYLLIYSDHLMGSVALPLDCPMELRHVSNAACLMLAPFVRNEWSWEEHLRGLSESLGIMVGRGSQKESPEFWQGIINFENESGLKIYRRPMKIEYSSSAQEAIVKPVKG